MKTEIGVGAGAARLLAVALCVLVGPGCGGSSSPSAPAPAPQPTPTPPPVAEAPTVIDGWTEQGVVAEAEPPIVLPGHGVVARAPGYLPREQVYAGEMLALWPGDEGYVTELVYASWEFGDGSLRMIRWAQGFTISLQGDLAADDAAVNKANEVAAELSRRTGLAISVGSGGAVRVIVDPSIADDQAAGLTRLSFSGPRIMGATVSFIDRAELLGTPDADYRNTFLHEMGHVVGLGHSASVQDVMTPGAGPGTDLPEFREPEAISLHMMYLHREAGNRPPDRDEGLLAASLGSPLTVVVPGCRPPLGPRQ